jgi:hypothetical protein
MAKPTKPIQQRPARVPENETDLEKSARRLAKLIEECPDHPQADAIRAQLAQFEAIRLQAEKLKH